MARTPVLHSTDSSPHSFPSRKKTGNATARCLKMANTVQSAIVKTVEGFSGGSTVLSTIQCPLHAIEEDCAVQKDQTSGDCGDYEG